MKDLQTSNQAIFINSLKDLKEACNHPYRTGEFLTDDSQIFEVSLDDNINECLIESYEDERNALTYHVNWEDNYLFTEDGTQIPPVY